MSVPKHEYVSDVWREGCMDGLVVFCTGGAGTICSAQVRALVYLGANACIVGRNTEKTESMARDIATARKGAKVLGIGGLDVRKPETLQAAVSKCVEALGGIDIAIAGAAGNFLAPITQLSENAFKSVIDIDVLGSYNTVKATLPQLLISAARAKEEKARPGPRLLFVSATLHYTGTPLQTHVTAAKAAVDALSVQTAIEYGPRGITSNVIAPGGIANTEGMARLSDPDVGDRPYGPMGRLGTIKNVADATVWLCSDAGSYINGTVVVVDGGAWRTNTIGGAEGRFKYPEFLLSGDEVSGVTGLKKQSAKI